MNTEKQIGCIWFKRNKVYTNVKFRKKIVEIQGGVIHTCKNSLPRPHYGVTSFYFYTQVYHKKHSYIHDYTLYEKWKLVSFGKPEREKQKIKNFANWQYQNFSSNFIGLCSNRSLLKIYVK